MSDNYPHLTGRYRYRQLKRWWTTTPLIVLQIEAQYRDDAPIGGTGKMIKYWVDANEHNVKADIRWEHTTNEWDEVDLYRRAA